MCPYPLIDSPTNVHTCLNCLFMAFSIVLKEKVQGCICEFPFSNVWLFTFQYLKFDIHVQFSILLSISETVWVWHVVARRVSPKKEELAKTNVVPTKAFPFPFVHKFSKGICPNWKAPQLQIQKYKYTSTNTQIHLQAPKLCPNFLCKEQLSPTQEPTPARWSQIW